MSYEYDFNNFAIKALNIEFACPNCGCEVFGENLCVPLPDLLAERSVDSENLYDECLECPHCEKEYDVVICSSMCGGFLTIDDLNKDWVVKIDEIDDYESYFNDISDVLEIDSTFAVLQRDVFNLQKLMNIQLNNKELQDIFYRQVFSGAITCLEDYLSNTLIKNTLNSDVFLRNFVNKYRPFSEQKINIRDISEKFESINDFVKDALVNDIMYHNLQKIKPIYEQTFGIDFPEIESVIKAIIKRHDFVHRNGKDKNGNIVVISADDVNNLLKEVLIFSQDIDKKISNQIQNSDE